MPVSEAIDEDIVSFFDAFGNATHTALMFDVVGEDVLITGAGPIGMMAAAICRQNGARRVVVTDVNEYRLKLAKKMGATAIVNVAKQKLEDVMVEQNIVEGFDVGLEMSGNGAALNQMLLYAKRRQGYCWALQARNSDRLERCNIQGLNTARHLRQKDV